ncbi:MAG: phage major capsid protein [Nitrospirota bacterium]|jgi:HK97 family phage major capsid protein|nr:MAG: phage major capsid protein [Nitrospirota bacterium]
MSDVTIESKDGAVETVDVPQVTKQAVDSVIKALMPQLRDVLGEAAGQTIRDGMEQSFEDLAKKMESNAPISRKFANGLISGTNEIAKEQKAGLHDYLKCLGQSKGDLGQAIHMAKEMGNDHVVRALNASTMDSVGMLVPEEMAAQIIELRDNATVMRQLAPAPIRLRGTRTLPREASRAQAFWADESEDLTLTSTSLDQDRLVPKKLTCLMVATNELLNDATNVESYIQRQMSRAIRLNEDATFLRSPGTLKRPAGLKSFIDAGNTFNRTKAGASATVDEIFSDLVEMMRLLKVANHEVGPSVSSWIINSTTWSGLANKLSTTQDTRIFLPEMLSGRLMGIPFAETNQIPDNLGGSSNQSELYLVTRDYMTIADSDEIRLDASRDASYKDEVGTLVSAWSRDEVAYRLITRTDFYYQYRDGAALLEQVDWQI